MESNQLYSPSNCAGVYKGKKGQSNVDERSIIYAIRLSSTQCCSKLWLCPGQNLNLALPHIIQIINCRLNYYEVTMHCFWSTIISVCCLYLIIFSIFPPDATLAPLVLSPYSYSSDIDAVSVVKSLHEIAIRRIWRLGRARNYTYLYVVRFTSCWCSGGWRPHDLSSSRDISINISLLWRDGSSIHDVISFRLLTRLKV